MTKNRIHRKTEGMLWQIKCRNSAAAVKQKESTNHFFEQDGYQWVNCEFSRFEQYCEPRYKQWVIHNCGIDVV